jgi:DNA-binding transcriptional LysR family regulator
VSPDLRLDVRLLLAFDALIAERSVTRAARRLRITQQGLSGQIARLRAVLGDPLFVRERGGVAPTPRAVALQPLIRAVLAGLEAVAAAPAFDPQRHEGTASIAASDYAMALLLPPLLRRLRDEAPALRLVVRPVSSGMLEREVREQRVDLVLTVPEFMPPGLRTRTLFRERYIGAVRAGHALAGAGAVSLEGFCAHPHLLVAPFRGDAVGPTDRALAEVGRTRRIGLVVPSFSVVGALLEASDHVAVLPERLVRALPGRLHVFEPPVPIEGFRLELAWPPRLEADAMQRWLRRVVLEAARAVGTV